MRVLALALIMARCMGTAPRPLPDGMPEDWGRDPMDFVRVEVGENTCGEVEPPMLVGTTLFVTTVRTIRDRRTHTISGRRGEESDGVGACASDPNPVDGGYLIDCGSDAINLALDTMTGIADQAEWTRSGFFASPTAVRIDSQFEVGECGPRTQCGDYIEGCVITWTTWHGDWE